MFSFDKKICLWFSEILKIDKFIDNILKKYKDDYKIIHKNYKLRLQKIK